MTQVDQQIQRQESEETTHTTAASSLTSSSSSSSNAAASVVGQLSPMAWLATVVVAAICLLGPGLLFTGAVCLICFGAGCLLRLAQVGSMLGSAFGVDHSSGECRQSRGIGRVIHWYRQEHLNYRQQAIEQEQQRRSISGHARIDALLNEILDHVMRDYVADWYDGVSDDKLPPTEMRKLLHQLMTNIAARCASAAWTDYLTQQVPEEFGCHIRLYRRSLEQSLRPDDLEATFFRLECDMEDRRDSRGCLTEGPGQEGFLRDLADTVLCLLLPTQEFQASPSRSLLTDIAVNYLLQPTIELFASPDYVNQNIIWFSREDAYAYEFLMQAVLTAEVDGEVKALLEFVNSEMSRLRSQDAATGGGGLPTNQPTKADYQTDGQSGRDELNGIKQQLSSLDYIRTKCEERIRVLQPAANHLDLVTQTIQPSTLTKQKSASNLHQLPFDSVMKNSLALNYFYEFLVTINAVRYLDFFLNIEGFRLSAASIMFNLFGRTQQQTGSAGRDAASLRASISEQAASIFAMYFDSAGGGGSGGGGGAGGADRLPLLNPGVIRRTQQSIQSGRVDETVFDDLRAEVLRVLELDQFYGRFKQSQGYRSLLEEMDLLREDTVSRNSCEGEIDSPLADQEAEDAASPMEEYEVQYSAKIMRHELIKADGDKHTSYVIHVCKVCDSSHTYEWDVYRRYSEFDELRSALVEACEPLGHLHFPAKNSFRNNMNPNLISQRQAELDLFLQQALTFNYSASERYLCARSMLYKFLAPGSLSPGAFASGPGGFGVSGAFGGAAGGATLPAPLRMMRQGSQDIIDGVKRNLLLRVARPAAGAAAFAQSASTLGQLPEELRAIGSDLGGSGEVADQENVPLRILLLVMDEIFDVRERNKLIRKGIAAVLSKLVRALLGDRVNRRIVQFARVLTSADRVAYYLQSFRDSFWPQGQPAAPYPTRDSATLMRTRLLCRAKLLGSVSTELRQVLGNQTTRQGVARLFNMFQHANLNRRLVYVLLEGTVCLLFPDYRMDQAFRRMYARQRLRIGKPQQPGSA
ncbi:hypothetical protein BOX15_Mlig016795g1 [Macrostomum lignano]|uniref:Sorting nexin-13 n=1 Tax=Macrostomum lignano TaxID=282301 RepID=A0A267FKG2_9PLAT|nr:hypothetical protein BOX15_Mlig016795g1 [Macrostomum lignano]